MGDGGQRAEFVTLISIFSLLPGKSGNPGKRDVPVRNAECRFAMPAFDSLLAPRDYL